MKLSHIIYSVFKKCQFTGRLEYIFLLLITYLVFLQYRCLFLRWYTVCTVSGSVKAARSDIKATDLPATAPCKLNTCSAVEERSCGHTGQNSRKKISFKIEQSAAELWRLGKYFQEGELSISTPQRGSTKLHQIGYFDIDALLRFEMTAAQRTVVSKSLPNFTLFAPSLKIMGGVWENAERDDRVDPMAEPVECIWQAAAARCRTLEPR